MRDVRVVLHIGLQKTASTFVQGVLGAHRPELLAAGVLYPRTGEADEPRARTREGAQSGHVLLTRRRGRPRAMVKALLEELPESASTVLLSSEDFTRDVGPPPVRLLTRLGELGTVEVVLVLRRQDLWIESLYKQLVDQYRNFETRSLEEFVRAEGPTLLDFHARFTPWRELVGPENFHVLSYDDLPGGQAICRRILEIAGVRGPLLEDLAAHTAPRYDSVRAIDTLGLRILNSYRLTDRDARTRTARAIYDLAPAGEIELMSAQVREEICSTYGPVNERIEAEWFGHPVPGLRFGAAPRATGGDPPSGPEVVEYVEGVISRCEAARRSLEQHGATSERGA